MKVKELINWLKECPEDMEVDIRILGKTFVDEYAIDD